MNTRIRLAGASLALAAVFSIPTTLAVDSPDGVIAGTAVEYCGRSAAASGPISKDANDRLADTACDKYAEIFRLMNERRGMPVAPLLRLP